MKRVLIIGSPGSGKTTFAAGLAKKTGLPLIHLDYYYHDRTKDYYNEKNKPAWRAQVMGLLKPESWICDGNYSSTFPQRFKLADTIIYFDFPLYLRMYGIFKRRLEFRNKKRKDMPNDWRETADWEFVKFVWNFRKKYNHKITDIIDNDTSKKVI